MNTYEFHYTHIESGSLLGYIVEADNPQDAWAQFEAKHPPRKYLVTRMFLFWDGAQNRPSNHNYDIQKFQNPST